MSGVCSGQMARIAPQALEIGEAKEVDPMFPDKLLGQGAGYEFQCPTNALKHVSQALGHAWS